jgi:hypothetical protein
MSDYIKRKDILVRFTPPVGITIPFLNVDVASIISLINSIPAADVQPVKRGKWRIRKEKIGPLDIYVHECSACGGCTPVNVDKYNYCPNCGAKMEVNKDV